MQTIDDALACKYVFRIRTDIHGAETCEEARNLFNTLRDESGEGASTWPSPPLYRDGKIIGWFSYNGRIWANKEYNHNDQPLNVEDL